MKQINRLDLPNILKKYHISPKKSLGQNFLWDPNILANIVAAAEIPRDAHVLEIGAGIGTLTRHLAESAQVVKVVEIDRQLLPALEAVLARYPNVEIIIGDILELKTSEIMGVDHYYVVANIPFYITSILIRKLLESPCKPARMVLTVQNEVAKRVCETPGNMSLLALSVQVYGEPRLEFKIPAGAFYPVPDVDSAVLRIDLYPSPRIPSEQLELFFRLTKAGFHQKRKKMRNAIAEGMHVSAETVEKLLVVAGIDPASRAQILDIDDWASIVRVWADKRP